MYVILGCGSVGYNAAKHLKSRDKEILIIDKSRKRVEDLRDAEMSAIVGDMEDLSPFKDDLAKADALLLMSSYMEANLAALKWIRKELPEAFTIVRALDPISAEAFEKAGADRVITPSDVIARSVVRELQEFEATRAGNALTSVLKGAKSIAIFLQNNPDPDAFGSGLALKAICEHYDVAATLYYGGNIGHQENRAFVNLLDVKLVQVGARDDVNEILSAFDRVALVEASVPGKNNILPKGTRIHVIFDHHQVEQEDIHADFADVRIGVGATSTILTKYLQQLGIPVTPQLAVALLYGIRTDTRGFTRGATAEDMAAATFLSSFADMELLEKIETPPMAGETLDVLGKAIMNRELYGSTLLTCVGFVRDRDTLPQAADFLLQLEGVATVVVYGIVEDVIHISARSNDVRMNLGEALEKAFGKTQAGGHAKLAGGQIKLGIFGDVDEKDALMKLARDAVRKQFLNAIGIEEPRPEGIPVAR
ncbi:MAG TPA: DHH family phosphoesterase [Candidatus Thermoplasmatota archaeon]|nr:DHH family phosphoesterase [Candidatus Thermoplasmatota archaeon]